MTNTGELRITVQGECEIVITRAFHAPRQLVFDAYTKPELIRQWLLGPDGWTMPICEVDLRVGGKYRYVWRHAKGHEMGMGGEYREIAPPGRIVFTEKFDESWYPGGAVGTLVLTESAGITTLTQTMHYESGEARDAVMQSPMEKGLTAGFDRMAKLLDVLQAK